MERIPPPVARRDQLKPFRQTEIDRLLDAARRSCNPKRNEAIICLLYDTGIRASELCALKRKDVDLGTYRCTVLGKGNKTRTVSFARTTLKALTAYLGDLPKQPDEPLLPRTEANGLAMRSLGGDSSSSLSTLAKQPKYRGHAVPLTP
jgi:integrase